MFRTPAMKDIFSMAVGVFASFHRLPIRSMLSRIRFLYWSSCSSAVGTTRRHSSTTLSLAEIPVDLSFCCCLRTFSLLALKDCCRRSRRCGRAKFSRTSNMVRRSRGGKPSSSPSPSLMLVYEFVLDSRAPGVVGADDK